MATSTMSPTTTATLTLLLLAPARTLADGATATARVYYIRHGQSQWNAEQTAMRKSGLSDAAIKKIGDEERFVDSPLSARGVNEALTLQRNLTLTPGAPWYTLGGVGWYRKAFTPPAGGGMTHLFIEGCYMNCSVFLNGKHLATHPYGYTPPSQRTGDAE